MFVWVKELAMKFLRYGKVNLVRFFSSIVGSEMQASLRKCNISVVSSRTRLVDSLESTRGVVSDASIAQVSQPGAFAKIVPAVVEFVCILVVYLFRRIVADHHFPNNAPGMIGDVVQHDFCSGLAVANIVNGAGGLTSEAGIPSSGRRRISTEVLQRSIPPSEFPRAWFVVERLKQIVLRWQGFDVFRHVGSPALEHLRRGMVSRKVRNRHSW